MPRRILAPWVGAFGASAPFLAQIREDLFEGADEVSLVDLALAKAQRQAEGPLGVLETEDVRLSAAGLAALAVPAQALAQVVPIEAAAGHLFEEIDHLGLAAGFQDFEQQRLRGD